MPESQEKELSVIRELLGEAKERIDRILEPAEPRYMRWRCLHCGYIKHFTRPMPAHVAPLCPKCAGVTFAPV